MLVCAACPANHPQLQDEEYRRSTSSHDVSLVSKWRTVRRIRNCATIQYTFARAAAVLLFPVQCELGTVSGIREVRVPCNRLNFDREADKVNRKWKTWTAALLLASLYIVFAGIQAGLVFAIRPAYARGTNWPVLLVGIIAFIVMIAGYFPIPFELLKRRGRVVGIDFVFLAIDWFGAFFSLMSLVAQHEFDALFGTLYALW